MAFRCDRGLIFLPPKPELTREGFLRCYGRIARTGSLRYLNKDGSERIEQVSKKTLFAPESISSFLLKPFTHLHPKGVRVNRDNAHIYQKGTLGDYPVEDALEDGSIALGFPLCITHGDAIDAVLSGSASELSCGYDAKTQLVSDSLLEQIHRLGNHVAGVPKGRAGADVRFCVDSADTEELALDSEAYFQVDAGDIDKRSPIVEEVLKDLQPKLIWTFDAAKQPVEESKTAVKYQFTLDGIGFETDDINLVNTVKTVNEKLVTTSARADAAEKEKSTLEGTLAGVQTELKTAKDAAEARMDADEVSTQVTLRLDAWGEVLPYLRTQDADFKPDYKLDAIDVKRLYLSKRTDADLTNKDAAFVEGMYEALKPPTQQAIDEATSGDRVDSILDGLHTGRNDASYEAKIEAKRKARLDRISANGKALVGGNK